MRLVKKVSYAIRWLNNRGWGLECAPVSCGLFQKAKAVSATFNRAISSLGRRMRAGKSRRNFLCSSGLSARMPFLRVLSVIKIVYSGRE